jgi:O-antigen ligase
MSNSQLSMARLSEGRQKWLLAIGMWLAGMAVGSLLAIGPELLQLLIPAMLMVIVVLALSMRYEQVPFYLLVATLAGEDLLKIPNFPNPMMTVFGSLAILAWLLRLMTRRATIQIAHRSTFLAVLLGGWASLSAINADGLIGVLTSARPFWLVIMLFILTQNQLREKQHFVQLGWILAISLAAVSALIFYEQVLTVIQSGGLLSGQKLHHAANHNLSLKSASGIWGMRIAKGLPFAIYLMLQLDQSKTRRYLLLFCTLFMIMGPLSTISINATFGIGLTLALMMLFLKGNYRWLYLPLAGVIAFGLLWLSPLGERLNNQYVALNEEDALYWGSNRGVAWYVGYQAIRRAPLLGIGPAHSDIVEFSAQFLPNRITRYLPAHNRVGLNPHNVFLNLGARIGLPGVLIFIALFISILQPLWLKIRRQRITQEEPQVWLDMGQAILIGLVAFLPQGMVISVELDKYIWLLLGAAVAYTRLSSITSYKSHS